MSDSRAMHEGPGSEDPQARGVHDFDFWLGAWAQRNRRLRYAIPAGCQEWLEFDSTVNVWSTLDGAGNVDTLESDDFPEVGRMRGMTWRILDPGTGRWRIWWASTTRPGVVDEPVEGAFDGAIGTFECDDEISGVSLRVRYEWDATDPERPTWRQSFSFDRGATWELNWVAQNTRIPTRAPIATDQSR